MVNILKTIVLNIISMLPDSPISSYLDNVDADFFDYLNWFLPVDICSMIFGVWLICIGIYYIFLLIKQVMYVIVDGIIKDIMFWVYFI